MSNRGLGIGKDSIFKNTIEENKKLKSTKKKTEKKESELEVANKEDKKAMWEQISVQVYPKHRKFIKEQAFFQDKQIREVLNDIIQFYIDNKK